MYRGAVFPGKYCAAEHKLLVEYITVSQGLPKETAVRVLNRRDMWSSSRNEEDWTWSAQQKIPVL